MNTLTLSLSWPMGWLHQLNNRLKTVRQQIAHRQAKAQITAPRAEYEPVSLTVRASLPLGRTDVVCLTVEGELNRHTYLSLIETACTHYHAGRRYLLLDLRQTTQIELSGLFALLYIARLYSGQPLLDPEAGWAELRRGVDNVSPALGERVKLLAPSLAAVAALERASFCRCFTRYPNLETAMSAL